MLLNLHTNLPILDFLALSWKVHRSNLSVRMQEKTDEFSNENEFSKSFSRWWGGKQIYRNIKKISPINSCIWSQTQTHPSKLFFLNYLAWLVPEKKMSIEDNLICMLYQDRVDLGFWRPNQSTDVHLSSVDSRKSKVNKQRLRTSTFVGTEHLATEITF